MSGPRETEITRLFPCLHVLRAVGIAIEPRKLLLGMVGLFLLAAGFQALANLPFAPPSAKLASGPAPANWLRGAAADSQLAAANSVLEEPLSFDEKLLHDSGARLLLAPAITLLEPAAQLFQSGGDVKSVAWNVTLVLWTLLVWSIIGGALARMTALQFAKRERISIRQAVKFSSRQTLSYLIAPALPLGGIGVLLAFNALLGLVGSIPAAGGPILGVIWGLILFVSFLMMMMLIGIVTGWPLMIAAISTEDSDGFDGLSRSFGFLYDRPWYMLLLAGLGVLAGLVGWFLLNVMLELTVHLASWSVSAGYVGSGELHLPLADSPEFQATGASTIGEFLISGWMTLFSGLLAGFGPSFFFCAVTVIYFLVRKSDDGTELSEVAVFLEPEAPKTEDPGEAAAASPEASAELKKEAVAKSETPAEPAGDPESTSGSAESSDGDSSGSDSAAGEVKET
ncbi:MAG: ABC transporter permease [Planctomycetes bacterium]|nr:ABC transporter permease [Planctomycetota bacterium]